MNKTMKDRIIEILLEKPRTTGEIAKKLGYFNEEGRGKYGKYNVVLPNLRELESNGIINSTKVKEEGAHGPPPTVYDIIYKMLVFQKIWREFPALKESLQTNDKVLSLLAEKHNWITNILISDLLQGFRDSERYLYIFEHGEEPTSEFLQNHGVSEDFFKEVVKGGKIYLKSKLGQSARFFKLFIENEPDELRKICMDSFLLSETGQACEYIKTHIYLKEPNGLIRSLIYLTAIEQIFKTCVHDDVLNGYKNIRAIRIIKEMNRNSPRYNNIINTLENLRGNVNFSSPDSIQCLIFAILLEGGYPNVG